MKNTILLALVITAGFLTACGGGGGGSASAPTTPTPTPPPANPGIVLPAPNTLNTTNWRVDEFRVNYGLDTINADAAYQRGYFGEGVTVAVVDSGVFAAHNNFSGHWFVEGQSTRINPILSGAARRFDAGGRATVDGALADPDGHGTGVAAIIAGTFDAPDDRLGHGVAPLAKILPLRISDDDGDLVGSATAAFHYAVDNNVHIINNSFGPTHIYRAIADGGTRRASIFAGPVVPQILQVPGLMGLGSIVLNRMRDQAAIFRGRDVAVVWAGGNDGWNSETGIVAVTIYEEFSVTTDLTGGITVSADVIAMTTTFSPRDSADNLNVLIPANGTITTISRFEANGVSGSGLAPIYHPELRGRWLAVVNTDSNNRIWRESNGCGSQAKYWCLAAPGVGISAANRGNDDDLSSWTGTSQSAPHVSGALALLKSRLPNMPMSVLVHLLLTTATDLGVAGVDDVYGHGLVNVSAAINRQGNIRLQSASSQGVLLQNANMELPSSFAGFAKRLNGVGVAAEYLDGFYYDAPLGGMVRTQSKKQKPLNFAAEMFDGDTAINEDGVFAFSRNGALRSAGWKKGAFQVRHYFHNKPSLWQSEGGDIVRRPFFADDGGYSDEIQMAVGDNLQLFAARGEEQKAEYSQMGISWRRSLSSIPKLRLAAAHSHISESDTLLGGKFGGLMPLKDGGAIRQTDIGASYALDSRWRLYGGYQRADINAKFGGIVGEMSGVMAEGWNSGFAARDWLREGDTFRIGIGKQTSISRGDMVLRINQSSNPQKDESTQAMHNRGYETTEQRISLAEEAPLFFAIGYAFTPGDNSQLAIALTHRRESPSALSINWRWDF